MTFPNPVKYLDNGIFLTAHSRDRMKEENIDLETIKLILENGEVDLAGSKYNDPNGKKWNIATHFMSMFNDRTAIWCISKEKGILIITIFNGKGYNLMNNPYILKR